MEGLLADAGWPRRVSVLDIATGSADMPAALCWGARRGIELQATGLDIKDDILAEARRYLDRAAPRVRLVQGDALRLPLADASVDLAICSTFLHHLDNEQARRALAEMKRVARLGVVAADLARSRVAWWLVWALTHVTSRNRLTRNEGPLSVRRSFTAAELRTLAWEAGLGGVQVGVVLWIGGVAFVTTVLLPAVRRFKTAEERVGFFESVERRFASQARATRCWSARPAST